MLKYLLALSCIVCLYSCTEEPLNDTFEGEVESFLSGFFMVSEDGSLSYYERFEGTITENAYQNINGEAIGAVLSDVLVDEENLWLLNPEGGEMILADPDFLTERRRFSIPNNTRFVTDNSGGTVWLTTFDGSENLDTVFKTDSLGNASSSFQVGKNAGPALIAGTTLYVPNGAGPDLDSTVTLINITADTIIKQLTLPAPNPVEGLNVNGILWFLCQGYAPEEGAAALVAVTAQNVSFSLLMPIGINELTVDNSSTYFFYNDAGKVYRQPLESTNRNTEVFIDRNYRLLEMDPISDELIGVEISENGAVFHYHNVETGEETASFSTDKTPVKIFFKDK